VGSIRHPPDRLALKGPSLRTPKPSTNLFDAVAIAPAKVRGPHLRAQALSQCETQPISQGQTDARAPTHGGQFGVNGQNRLDREAIAL